MKKDKKQNVEKKGKPVLKEIVKHDIIAAGLIFTIGIMLIRKLFPRDVQFDHINNEQNNLLNQGEELTYPVSEYKTMADIIYSAGMDTFGTDEDTIYNVFERLQNNVDYLQLYKAFGRRRAEFTVCWGNDCPDLPTWLHTELNSSEIEHVNNILERKGIKYRV